MKLNRPYMLIVFGPTAVGKTEFADKLSNYMPIEIINMDVGQLYKPLTIGTAKPAWRKSPITHHLFDILDKPINMTVVEYRGVVKELVMQINARAAVPVLVGGSGFYLKSLLFPPAHETASNKEPISSTQDLWEQLHAIDPVRAAAIHKHDTYRIKRALHIWHTTGNIPSAYKPLFDPIANSFILCLTRDKQELYQRINERVQVMIKEGWIDEVARLCSTAWEPFLHQKKIIGYDLLLDYIQERYNQSLESVIAAIQQKTRNYAKRQATLWRGLVQQITNACTKQDKRASWHCITEEVDLTFIDLELYIRQLSNRFEL